jgi:hypothetical protein
MPGKKYVSRLPIKRLTDEQIKAAEAKKRPFVPFRDLHKKTYFNALEKLLTSPQDQNKVIIDKLFEASMRSPPMSYKKPARQSATS